MNQRVPDITRGRGQFFGACVHVAAVCGHLAAVRNRPANASGCQSVHPFDARVAEGAHRFIAFQFRSTNIVACPRYGSPWGGTLGRIFNLLGHGPRTRIGEGTKALCH